MSRKNLITALVIIATIAAVAFYGGTVKIDDAVRVEAGNFEKYGSVGAGRVEYMITGEGAPAFKDIVIDPLDVHVGDTQTFTVFFDSSQDIVEVTSFTELDNEILDLPLTRVSEESGETVFSASWKVYDTHTNTYRTKFTARDAEGNVNSVTMTWTDPCSGIVHGVDSSITSNCAVSSVDGLDSGNITIPPGVTLTLNTGGTFVWTPGYSITVNGAIAIASGASLQSGYLFYGDSDGDGSGDGTLTWDPAPASTGYVRAVDSPTTDCDTINTNVYQNIGSLRSDDDQDGYADTGSATRCVGDSTIVSGRTYYRGTGGGYSWLVDSQKLGTSDCNDGSATAWRYRYVDSDGDGDGAGGAICVGNHAGYSDSASDCNNGNANVWRDVSNLGNDDDQDGYYEGSLGTQCVGYSGNVSGRTYYRNTANALTWLSSGSALGSSDCNDANGSVQVNKYIDADSDGYTPSAITYCVGAGASGYISSPATLTDCADNSANVYQNVGGLSLDDDFDGYTASSAATRCVGIGSGFFGRTYYRGTSGSFDWLVDSQKLGTNDCNDGSSSVWVNGYTDSDGDGYGTGVLTCMGAGGAAQGGDCYDSNANARPGQTSYFTSHRGDGSYDYNCVSGAEKLYPSTSGRCVSTQEGWTTSFGGFGSDPGCGGTSWWADCFGGTCTDPCPSYQQTQACR